MFGQKDGTSNPRPGSTEFADTVWALPDEPGWFAAGTYLVSRPRHEDHHHGGHGKLDVGLLCCAYGNDPDSQLVAARQRRRRDPPGLRGSGLHRRHSPLRRTSAWRPP